MIDHKIWHDFKHIDLNIDTAIVFPHGSGGHYIANYWIERHEGRLNEYHVSLPKLEYPWFRLDTWGVEYANNEKRLDDMYDVVSTIMIPNMQNRYPIMMGHYMPYLTSKTFNMTIDKLINITVKEEWAWLPMLLANAKNLFTASYASKHFLIGHILSNYDMVSKQANSLFKQTPMYSLMTADTLIVANERSKHLRQGFVDDSSPYMWDYIVWAKSNGHSINEETFKEFTTVVFGEDEARNYYNDYYKSVPNVDGINDTVYIDYIDLFFTRKATLPGINTQELRNYSLENLKIVKKILSLSTGSLYDLLSKSVPILEDYLN